MEVGGNERDRVDDGLKGFGAHSSMCITDRTPLSGHTHSPPYSNSSIQEHFPTGKVKAPIKRAFCCYFVFVAGKVSGKGRLVIEGIFFWSPSL